MKTSFMLERPCFTQKKAKQYVRVELIKLDCGGVLRLTVKPSDGDAFQTTKKSLRNPNSPDIGWIPTTVPEKRVLFMIYQMR